MKQKKIEIYEFFLSQSMTDKKQCETNKKMYI